MDLQEYAFVEFPDSCVLVLGMAELGLGNSDKNCWRPWKARQLIVMALLLRLHQLLHLCACPSSPR